MIVIDEANGETEIRDTQKAMVRRMMERPSGCSTRDMVNQPKLVAEYRRAISEVREELRKEGKGGRIVVNKITSNNFHYHISYPDGQSEMFREGA